MVFRLKLGNGFQYEVNPKGSIPAEVIGINYKATLKSKLESYAEKIRESSKENFEDVIILQEQSKEMDIKIENQKYCIVVLQSHIDEVSALKSGLQPVKVVNRYCRFLLLLLVHVMVSVYFTCQDLFCKPYFLGYVTKIWYKDQTKAAHAC